ncbi:MAG: PASTA domain-containing protein [Gemmatimonadetes bacterium]|nr:PASTA domain-containing protein [Gemmatimonadota bacterium]
MQETRAAGGSRGVWRRLRATLTSRRKALLLALGTSMVGLLVGYSVSVFVLFPGERIPGGLVPVPDLTGREREEARRLVEERGLLYVETDTLHHPSVPAGRVVAQDPLADQWAVGGAEVRVTVSLGPARRPLPNVVGLRHEVATLALSQAGFEAVLSWVDAQAAVGEVVGTRPAPGTPLELPAEVTVLVSAGPEQVVVPDLVGRSLAEARSALQRLGLRLGRVMTDPGSDAAPGTVLAQTPLPGTGASRGDSISLAVAAAREGEGSAEDSVANDRGDLEEGT